MSLMLKGIDLPKSKDNRYIIQIYNDGEIHIAEEVWDDTKNGHDKLQRRYIGKSQAVQIPEDHGRIIDAKLLKDMIKDSVPAYTAGVKIPTYGDLDLMDKIDMMPTILEAEE